MCALSRGTRREFRVSPGSNPPASVYTVESYASLSLGGDLRGNPRCLRVCSFLRPLSALLVLLDCSHLSGQVADEEGSPTDAEVARSYHCHGRPGHNMDKTSFPRKERDFPMEKRTLLAHGAQKELQASPLRARGGCVPARFLLSLQTTQLY